MAATDLLSDTGMEGYEANVAGLRPPDNPYSWKTENEKCQEWIQGYNMARSHRIKANRQKLKGLL